MIPNTLEELTEWILKENDAYGALALHPFASISEQARLEKLMFNDTRKKLVFASAHYTPETVLDLLVQDQNSDAINKQICLRVAKHQNTSAKTLERIYQNNCSKKVILLLAVHPATPIYILEKIDWRQDKNIRKALCSNSNVPIQLIKKLIPLCGLDEKKKLVRHRHLDSSTLESLWIGGDQYLRAEVLAHSNCPTELILQGIESSNVLLRQRLAANPSIDASVRDRLLRDKNPKVRAAIVKNEEVTFDSFSDVELLELCNDPSKQVRRNEAKRAEITLQVVEKLSNDNDIWVRRWLAGNSQTPIKTLAVLALDEDDNVRRSVARNSNYPDQLIFILAQDSSSWVRAGVAMRTDISKEWLLEFAKECDIDVISAVGKNTNTPQKTLAQIAKSDNRDIRRSVILNRHATAETLEILQQDPYPLNRIFLGSRMQCNQQTRWALMNDPETEVRFSSIQTYAKKISI